MPDGGLSPALSLVHLNGGVSGGSLVDRQVPLMFRIFARRHLSAVTSISARCHSVPVRRASHARTRVPEHSRTTAGCRGDACRTYLRSALSRGTVGCHPSVHGGSAALYNHRHVRCRPARASDARRSWYRVQGRYSAASSTPRVRGDSNVWLRAVWDSSGGRSRCTPC